MGNGKTGARGMCEKSIEPESQCTCYEYGCENVGATNSLQKMCDPAPKKKMFEPELCHLTVSEFAQFIIFVFFRRVLLLFVFFCHHPVVLGFCFAFLHLLNMLNY